MIRLLISSLFCLLLFASCEENMPSIPCLSCDVVQPPVDPDDRKVLIEEFTGVHCVNCPQGSAEIENLLAIHGERVVAISVHAGFFSDPYPESLYDFRTTTGDQLINLLTEPFAYPSASINRKKVDGDFQVIGQAEWGGIISNEFNFPPIVNVEASNTFDSSNRELTINVSITPIDEVTQEIGLGIFITESEIEDVQLTPDGKDENYIHKHVLRDAVTTVEGETIMETLMPNVAIEKTFTYTLPDAWNASNCNVIAFVTDKTSKEILQVDESHVEN